jgi:hypothetical protein
MVPNVEARTEWTTAGAAYCGAVLGAVAVIVHQVYIVLFSAYTIADPFLRVMTEMAVLVPGGAMVFAAIASLRNRVLRTRLE